MLCCCWRKRWVLGAAPAPPALGLALGWEQATGASSPSSSSSFSWLPFWQVVLPRSFLFAHAVSLRCFPISGSRTFGRDESPVFPPEHNFSTSTSSPACPLVSLSQSGKKNLTLRSVFADDAQKLLSNDCRLRISVRPPGPPASASLSHTHLAPLPGPRKYHTRPALRLARAHPSPCRLRSPSCPRRESTESVPQPPPSTAPPPCCSERLLLLLLLLLAIWRPKGITISRLVGRPRHL